MVASHYNKDDNRDLAEGLKMRSLSRLLLFVFPPFGIVYILRLAGMIDRDSLLIGKYLALVHVRASCDLMEGIHPNIFYSLKLKI